MKKLGYTIVAILSFVIQVNAQEIKSGFRAGVNVSDWGGDVAQSLGDLVDLTNVVDLQNSVGYHIGGYLIIPVNEQFSIEPGLLYSRKGLKLTQSILDVNVLNVRAEAAVQAHYLDLPIMAKFKLAEGLHIYAGPQMSYLVANRLKAQAGILGFNVSESFKIDSGFRKLDMALAGGVGYQFANGFNITAGYDHGLSSLDNNGNFDVYNRVVKASIGYTF